MQSLKIFIFITMNNLTIKLSNYKYITYTDLKMLNYNLSDTIINDKYYYYKTLYHTIKNFGIKVCKDDINKYNELNKYDILNYYFNNDSRYNNNFLNSDSIRRVNLQLHTNFNNNYIKYFSSSNIKLINPNLPELFNNIRKKDIKITLNTEYPKKVNELIINKLNINEFSDDNISSEDVKIGSPYPYKIFKLMERNSIISPNNVINFASINSNILEGINAKCPSIGILNKSNSKNELRNAHYIVNGIMDIKN